MLNNRLHGFGKVDVHTGIYKMPDNNVQILHWIYAPGKIAKSWMLPIPTPINSFYIIRHPKTVKAVAR